jgi:hypothetical protein
VGVSRSFFLRGFSFPHTYTNTHPTLCSRTTEHVLDEILLDLSPTEIGLLAYVYDQKYKPKNKPSLKKAVLGDLSGDVQKCECYSCLIVLNSRICDTRTTTVRGRAHFEFNSLSPSPRLPFCSVFIGVSWGCGLWPRDDPEEPGLRLAQRLLPALSGVRVVSGAETEFEYKLFSTTLTLPRLQYTRSSLITSATCGRISRSQARCLRLPLLRPPALVEAPRRSPRHLRRCSRTTPNSWWRKTWRSCIAVGRVSWGLVRCAFEQNTEANQMLTRALETVP